MFEWVPAMITARSSVSSGASKRKRPVNTEIVNCLIVVAYLALGTLGIALLAGCLLKRSGPRK